MRNETTASERSVSLGAEVFDETGRLIGHVSGFTDDGFEAETVDTDEDVDEEVPGQEFGEGYLMWRCEECGEMDELEAGMPQSCPECGAPREAITAVQED